MPQATNKPTMPLPRACHELGVPWHAGYGLILSGKLEGEQRGSRWFVTKQSVEAVARERAGK
jgi:hypothetical protein